MIDILRRSIACAAIVAGSVLAPAAVASAAVTVPFQIDPAQFGNPNGSFDVPPVRCVAVVGEQSGTVMIAGGKEGRGGCLLPGNVHWLSLPTRMYGYPAAILPTGTGRVVVAVVIAGSTIITPGVATIYVR